MKKNMVIQRGIFTIALFTLLSACTSPAPTATSLPQPTAAPVATSTQPPSAKPTALDPCQLIPSQEASKLAGASFGPGQEEDLPGGAKLCTYGANTANVFTIEVVQAADAKAADADKAQFLADLQAHLAQLTSEGLKITQLPTYADGAVAAEASFNVAGVSLNGRAFGFRDGTVFFGFSDLVKGGPAPSSGAMQTEATLVLGRLG